MVAIGRKLKGSEGNVRNEVATCVNALAQNHTEHEPATQKESTVRENRPKNALFGGLKKSTQSIARIVSLHV